MKLEKDTINTHLGSFFVKYVALNIASMAGLSFYLLVDTLCISVGAGSHGLAALNIVLPFFYIMMGVQYMIAVGAATHFSVQISMGNKETANKTFTHAMVLGGIVGAVFFFTFVFFTRPLVMFFGADESLVELCITYIRTVMIFSPAFIISSILICFVRNDNNPKLAMIAVILSNLANVVLDVIFIFPLGMGMFGAALATGISPVVSMLVLSRHKLKGHNRFKLIYSKLEFQIIKKIITLGIPNFVTDISGGLVLFCFNLTIIGLAGNKGVAAYGIITNLALIAGSVFFGISQGIQPLVSTCYGFGNYKAIKKIAVMSVMTPLIFGLIFCLIGQFYPDFFVKFFIRDNDVLLQEMAAGGLKIYFTAFIAMGINIVVTAFCPASDHPTAGIILSLLRGLVLIPLTLTIMSKAFGILGVWWTVPITELLTLLFSLYFMISTLGKIKIEVSE